MYIWISLALAADPTAGATVYKTECSACHGTKGDGKGPASVALTPKPASFLDAAFWTAERTDEQLATSIRSGKPGTAMAGFPHLTDQQMADLLAYLRTFQPSGG